MPHIAPLSWLGLALMFWSLIASTMCFLWWNQHPKTQITSSSTSKLKSDLWQW